MSKPIYIKVGGSGSSDPVTGPFYPAAGQRDVAIPALKGLDFYIEKAGDGPVLYSNYTALSAGGFRYFENLTNGDEYWLHIVGQSYVSTSVGSYTNGFDLQKVLTALFGRIGWVQTPTGPTLDATNLISRSGRNFNDGSFHQIVSLDNIKGLMDKPNASDAEFNAYLRSMVKGAIMRCLTAVFDEPEYISQGLAYHRHAYAYNDQTIENTGKFVGFQISLPPTDEIAVQIDSVSLLFDSDVTFNLYVFTDVKADPVHTIEVTATANNQVIVDMPDLILNSIGAQNHSGTFYFGYFQDDLGSAKAIREQNICFSERNVYALQSIEARTNGSTIDKQNIGYSYVSYGLNPHISAFADHTGKIVKKPGLFDNVVGLQVVAQVAELILFNTRSNRTERILKDDADKVQLALELTGSAPISQSPKTTSLRLRIQEELDRIEESYNREPKMIISRIC